MVNKYWIYRVRSKTTVLEQGGVADARLCDRGSDTLLLYPWLGSKTISTTPEHVIVNGSLYRLVPVSGDHED